MDYDKATSYWQIKDSNIEKVPNDLLISYIEGFIKNHKTCALAVASGDFVRCTPLEYNYVNGCFYILSEGGLKFKALKDNKNVCMSIFDEYRGFGQLHSLQITGLASMVEPMSPEYTHILEYKNISVETIKQLPSIMYIIKITPTIYEFLNSGLKIDGYSSRQVLKVED